jgi:hypothetical protein
MRTRITATVAAAITVLLLLSVLLHGQSSVPTVSSPGRFQLIAGPFTAVISGAQSTQTSVNQGIFKIDTATGQTWHYATGLTKEGQYFERWVAIPD